MAENWLCMIEGRQLGPLPFTRLQQLAEAGRLKPNDYVRSQTQTEWSFATDVPNLMPAADVTNDSAESPRRRANASVAPPQHAGAGAIPVGHAVAAPPVPQGVAVQAGIPVGNPVPPPPPQGSNPGADAPFFVTNPSPPHVEQDQPIGRQRVKKRSNPVPLLIGGGVAIAILGVLVALLLSGALDSSSKELAEKKGKAKAKPVETPEEEEAEAEPAEDEPTPEEPAESTPVTPPNADERLLKSITRWADVSRIKSVRLGAVSVGVTGVWLSATEEGEPYLGAAEDAEPKEEPKFLVVKLQIDNGPGAAPLNYTGWSHDALLFDDAGKSIPPAAAEGERTKQRIAPGGTLADTLVFPLESIEFEKLRLLLPHGTVGVKDARHFAMEVPRHALGKGLDGGLASTSAAPRVAGGDAGEGIMEGEDIDPVLDIMPDELKVNAKAEAAKKKEIAAKAKEEEKEFDSFLDKLTTKPGEKDKGKMEKGKDMEEKGKDMEKDKAETSK